MYFQVICVVIFGFVLQQSSAGAKDKLHIRVHVPDVVNHHHHDKYIIHHEYMKPHSQAGYYHLTTKPQHHKSQYKQLPQKTQPSPGFHYGNDNPYVFEPYTGKYQQSWKTLKSEQYETKTVDNPFSDNPANKYIVKSSYKVREKLPFEDATTGYDKEFLYPISESEHDHKQAEKVVEYNSAKTDPFPDSLNETPIKSDLKQEKKPIEYNYYYKSPSGDYEYEKNVQTDYFPGNVDIAPVKNDLKQKKKPKEYNYYYKYPSSDYEYQRNVHLVNHYLNSDAPSAALQEENNKFDDYGYNDVDPDAPKLEKYEEYRVSDFDHFGPSDEESYHNYKTDGPSYGID